MGDLDVSAAFLDELSSGLAAVAQFEVFTAAAPTCSFDQAGSAAVSGAITASGALRARLRGFVVESMTGLSGDIVAAQREYGYVDSFLAGSAK